MTINPKKPLDIKKALNVNYPKDLFTCAKKQLSVARTALASETYIFKKKIKIH